MLRERLVFQGWHVGILAHRQGPACRTRDTRANTQGLMGVSFLKESISGGDFAVTQPTYVFDNAWKQGRARLDAVESLLDPGSERYLAATGLAPGWACLEIGAGGGSVAAWLRDQVGASGGVVATDLDTRYLEPLAGPTLEVRKHDIVTDDLESDTFDLVHARLVLEHIAERQVALE